MARFTGGWVKLHREILTHWIGGDGYAFSVWVTLLTWANHEDRTTKIPKQGLTLLKRGQLVTSAQELADRLGFQRMTVERRLKTLEDDGCIVQQVSTHGRIITICNYDEYQSIDDTARATNEQTGVRPRVQADTQPREHILKKSRRAAADSGESAPPVSALELIPPEPKGADVWAAYRAAYFAAYNVEPVRNAKANALCKQLVQRLGGDGAVSVVKFFLTHRQAYYVTRLHPLSACVADAEALHTQMLANHRVSSSDARAQDVSQANAQTIEIVAARMAARRQGRTVPDAE